MIICRWLAKLALALLYLPALAAAQSAGAAASAPGQPNSPLTVGEAVAGMLGYARWPVEPRPLRLCFLGVSERESAVTSYLVEVYAGRDFEVLDLGNEWTSSAGCAALYVGAYDAARWRRLATQVGEGNVLTICERSDPCSTFGMFSVHITADGGARFEANLDAVARSRVRIHPQVLRLGERGAAK